MMRILTEIRIADIGVLSVTAHYYDTDTGYRGDWSGEMKDTMSDMATLNNEVQAYVAAQIMVDDPKIAVLQKTAQDAAAAAGVKP